MSCINLSGTIFVISSIADIGSGPAPAKYLALNSLIKANSLAAASKDIPSMACICSLVSGIAHLLHHASILSAPVMVADSGTLAKLEAFFIVVAEPSSGTKPAPTVAEEGQSTLYRLVGR
jgi:hypothetical protein